MTYTQDLIDAGRAARAFRNSDRSIDKENEECHQQAIQKIDEVVVKMKTKNPNDFWVDGSPEYRKLTDVWAAERLARFVNSSRTHTST
jgi:hypothetical protein